MNYIYRDDTEGLRGYLDNGGDPTYMIYNRPLITIATLWDFEEGVSLLLNTGRIDRDAGWFAYTYPLLSARSPGITKLLLDYGMDPNVSDISGSTPLMLTSDSYPDRGTLSILLSHPGIEIEKTDNIGRTALHYACVHDNIHAITTLLDHGANMYVCDINGYRPFDLCNTYIYNIMLMRGRSLYQCRDRSKSYMSSFTDISILIV